MRTLFLLDRADLAALRSGEPFDLQVGGSVITLQVEQPQVSKKPAPQEKPPSTKRARRSHSVGFKRKVAAFAEEHGQTAAIKKFDVARSVVSKWMQRVA